MTVKEDEEIQVAPVATEPTVQNGAPMPTATATAVAVQPQLAAAAPSVVDVIAPTNMQAGYQFNVDAGGKMLRVAVPPGGVNAGQRFGAIILQDTTPAGGGGGGVGGNNPHNIPMGHWRDDICDCCKFGCCHAMCCMAAFCQMCALGQVMTRLKLNWCASPLGNQVPSSSAFKTLFIITTVYIIIDNVLGFIAQEDPDLLVIRYAFNIAYAILLLILMVKTRSYIRNKYSIPEGCCGPCDDCCCSFWCSPCTTCQMARHITDFDMYQPKCCGDTGLDPSAPEIV